MTSTVPVQTDLVDDHHGRASSPPAAVGHGHVVSSPKSERKAEAVTIVTRPSALAKRAWAKGKVLGDAIDVVSSGVRALVELARTSAHAGVHGRGKIDRTTRRSARDSRSRGLVVRPDELGRRSGRADGGQLADRRWGNRGRMEARAYSPMRAEVCQGSPGGGSGERRSPDGESASPEKEASASPGGRKREAHCRQKATSDHQGESAPRLHCPLPESLVASTVTPCAHQPWLCLQRQARDIW